MRRMAILVALSLPASVGGALAERGPIPLKAPTGYRDYCDGAKKGSRSLCPRGGAPQALWRPLELPTQASRELCPISTPHSVTTRVPPVLGSGPVYFAAGAYNPAERSTMIAPYPATEGSVAAGTGWNVAKAPLLMRRTLAQPLVVRGRRIDGPGNLGFSGFAGRRPFAAMQFPATASAIELGNYKAQSLIVWAAVPGCYALQIDGKTFSRVVVFRVEFR